MKKTLFALAALISATSYVEAHIGAPNEEAATITVPPMGDEVLNSSGQHRKYKTMTKKQAEEAIKKHLEAAKKDAEHLTEADDKTIAENLINHMQGNLDTVGKLDDKNPHFHHIVDASERMHGVIKMLGKGEKKHGKAAHGKKNHEKKHDDMKSEEKKDDKKDEKKAEDKKDDKKEDDKKHDDMKSEEKKDEKKAEDKKDDKKEDEKKHDDMKSEEKKDEKKEEKK